MSVKACNDVLKCANVFIADALNVDLKVSSRPSGSIHESHP